MEMKIQIKTPKGHASTIEKKLRVWILGFKKPDETWTNKNNNIIYWVVKGNPRRINKIIKNLSMYDRIINGVLSHKQIKTRLDETTTKELEHMLLKQSSIKVIKQATAQEIVEEGKTRWEKIKETFTKKD